MKKLFGVVCFLLLIMSSTCLAERWAFVAIGDNRSAYSSYRNVLEEIRDRRVNPEPGFPRADFVLSCGDMDPVEANHKIYEEVFGGRQPFFFPVRGNHERPGDVRFILERLLMPHRERIEIRGTKEVNYYADWKNVRLIVLDQYSDFKGALSNKDALEWVGNVIQSATKAAHIFVAFHEPILPGDPPTDKLWRILLDHRDRVRAVFAGHEHFYSHKRFPDEPGGINYINVGNAGTANHSDGRQTLVNVLVDNDRISYRVVQTPDKTRDFRLKDQW